MASLAVRFGGFVANSQLLDELFGRLLEDFTVGRRRAVRALLGDVVRDQALMLQLTPEAMEVFNASVLPRPGVRYGAVVAQAARPSLRSTLAVGLDPAAQVTHALYGALHQIIAAAPGRDMPRLAAHQARALRRAYRVLPDSDGNDGIVPTLSQTWGHVLHAAVGDHLDVLGHFGDAAHDPPHVDWLVTGSGFDRRAIRERSGRTWSASWWEARRVGRSAGARKAVLRPGGRRARAIDVGAEQQRDHDRRDRDQQRIQPADDAEDERLDQRRRRDAGPEQEQCRRRPTLPAPDTDGGEDRERQPGTRTRATAEATLARAAS